MEKHLNGIEINNGNKQLSTDQYGDLNEVDFYYLLGVFFRNKYFILGFTFAISVLSIIYVLIATPYYQSRVTLYPSNRRDEGGLIKQLATTLGMSNKTQGYYLMDVLNSRRIAEKVVFSKYKTSFFPDSVNLIEFWEFDKIDLPAGRIVDGAVKLLSASVKIKEDKETLLITLDVTTKDKVLSKDIALRYCDYVIEYLNTEQRNSIKEAITFTEERLKVARDDLYEAEEKMVKFQLENARLASPNLSVIQKRHYQQIENLLGVVVLLEKQVELLKIEEVKERPILNVLDYPQIVEKPVKPQKRTVVIINFIISGLAGYFLALLNEKAIKYNVYKNIITEFKRKHRPDRIKQ